MLSAHGSIPWRQVRDLGNVLRHGYHAVDDLQVWAIVARDLPPLRAAIEAMVADTATEEPS